MISRVLLVELFQVVGLGLVVLQVGFQRGQFLGVMGAVGFVIGAAAAWSMLCSSSRWRSWRLIWSLQQGDLPGQLAIGIMRLVGLGLGVADAALDDRLVDGVGFGRLLRHQPHPYKQPLNRSKHRFSFCGLLFTSSSPAPPLRGESCAGEYTPIAY